MSIFTINTLISANHLSSQLTSQVSLTNSEDNVARTAFMSFLNNYNIDQSQNEVYDWSQCSAILSSIEKMMKTPTLPPVVQSLLSIEGLLINFTSKAFEIVSKLHKYQNKQSGSSVNCIDVPYVAEIQDIYRYPTLPTNFPYDCSNYIVERNRLNEERETLCDEVEMWSLFSNDNWRTWNFRPDYHQQNSLSLEEAMPQFIPWNMWASILVYDPNQREQ